MAQTSGAKITHNYTNFRGVDFTDKEIASYRSPDALNVWKNYRTLGKSIETRPDIELVESYNYPVFGFFFYKVGLVEYKIVHSGVYLYNGHTQIYSGMNPKKSTMFVYNNILYILDGLHYLQFDGTEVKEVEGYVPTTTTGMTPSGQGSKYQQVNLLNPLRKNEFVGDGKSVEYVLDSHNEAIDTSYTPKVWVNDVLTTAFTVDFQHGIITFNEAPSIPDTDGRTNVIIQFSRTITGYRSRIAKCTKAIEFDNRIFFTGNPDYPTTIFHSGLYEANYVGDQMYYQEGNDTSPIRGMVAGNNALWVFKEPNQANTTIYYHIPTTSINDLGEYVKEYTTTHSSISTGCVADAINFNDDICFFSPRGMEAISGNIESEQVLAHRSGLVDSRLLQEDNYKKLLFAEYEGYLLVCIDNHIYLADSNQSYAEFPRYEWFYWEMPKDIRSTYVYNDTLYFGCDDGIYSLTNFDKNRQVTSYWTTPYDEFGYPQYQKSTNKKGCTMDCNGKYVKVYVSKDTKAWEWIKNHSNVSLYAVSKIKAKKFKGIQLKIESSYPFELFSSTLEVYVGGYLKK